MWRVQPVWIVLLVSFSGCTSQGDGITWGLGLSEEDVLAEIAWEPEPGEEELFQRILASMRERTGCDHIDGDLRYPGGSGSHIDKSCVGGRQEARALGEQGWNESSLRAHVDDLKLQAEDAVASFVGLQSTGFTGLDMLISNMYVRASSNAQTAEVGYLHYLDNNLYDAFTNILMARQGAIMAEAFTAAIRELAPQCEVDHGPNFARLLEIRAGIEGWIDYMQGDDSVLNLTPRRLDNIAKIDHVLEIELGVATPFVILYQGRPYYRYLFSEETHLPTWGEGMYIFNSLIRNATHPGVRETIEMNQMHLPYAWDDDPVYGQQALAMQALDWSPIVADC